MAGKYDMSVATNETLQKRFLVTRNGAPRDLTGYTAKMHLVDSDGKLALNVTPYISVDNAAGAISLAAPVAGLTAGETYHYDLLLTSESNTIRLLYGAVTILQGVTI